MTDDNRKDVDDLCLIPLDSKMMKIFHGLEAGFYFDVQNREVFLSKKYVANLTPQRRHVVETLLDALDAEAFDNE